jgi:exopolysaccharide production protein ExoQ
MPQIAALIVLIIIAYLLWTDLQVDHSTSHAVWIPLLWMFLAGSRSVSQWLELGAPVDPMQVYMEGSPVDAAAYAALIIAGTAVLLRREIDWGFLLKRHRWVWFYFLFCALSILWADDSFVSLKRWVKALGSVVIALVLLTEERPIEAIGTVIRRLAFVTVPLSILFIKFYPDLGRAYHMGAPMYTGAATSKNGLGQICLISGIYFSWSLIFRWREEIEKRIPIFTGVHGIPHVVVSVLFLVLTAWLFYMADSATSLMCWIVVLVLFLAGRVPAVASEPRKFVVYGAIAITLLGVLEVSFGISDAIITSLGRSKDLTTRVPMWEMLLNLDMNPMLGVGYESFWSGDRMIQIWRTHPGIIQAHNGYLDLYLNVGLIGLMLFLICIVAGFTEAVKDLESEYAGALLRIAFMAAVILNNWTEATIKPVSNLFVILLLGVMGGSTWEEHEDDSEAALDAESRQGWS